MVDKTETCRSSFNVNFNVNFNVPLSKCIVHPLVQIKDFDNIKMHGTNMRKKMYVYSLHMV